MTVKLCLKNWLCNWNCMIISLLVCIILCGTFLLHFLHYVKPHQILPLFFFPFFHFLLIGLMSYVGVFSSNSNLLRHRLFKDRHKIIMFLLITLFYNVSLFGFQSNEYWQRVSIREEVLSHMYNTKNITTQADPKEIQN